MMQARKPSSRTAGLSVLLAVVGLAGPAAVDGQTERRAGDDTVDVRRLAIAAGDTVAYTDTGAGPVVAIVPGLLGSHVSFRRVIEQLVAAGQRVLVIDPLGTGASARPKRGDYSLEAQAARVGAVLAAAGARDVILVCHSVGGSMCYRLAVADDARLRGIVAINAGPDERAATPGLRFAMRFSPLIRLIGGEGRARGQARDGLRESSVDPSWVTDDIVDRYTRPFSDMDATLDALEGMADARDTVPITPRLASVAVPVRLVVGAEGIDGVTKTGEIEVLRSIPDFDVVRVAGAGAYVQEEQPQAIVDAVLALRASSATGRRR